jgi:phosphate butyryltransferase
MTVNFADIERLARERATDPVLMACVEPHEPAFIVALDRAMKNRLIKPVMIGEEEAIYKAAKEVGVETRGWELVRSDDPNHSVYMAQELIHDNKVGGICKGVFGTQDFLSLLFERKLGFRVHPNLVSGVMVCKNDKLDRLLLISDPIVNPQPELMDLVAILNNSVALAHKLGNKQPKAAILAAVEVIYPQMPVTVEAAVIAKMADKNQIKGCLVDGPLSLDVALSESAAKDKGATSPVAGHADILIGPNLATSYGVYRAFAIYTKSDYGLLVVGGRVPCVICSSFDSVDVRYNSLLLAVVATK